MPKSPARWAVAILLVASVCASVFAVQVRTAPAANAAAPIPNAGTCTYAAWYTVAGPNTGSKWDGAQVKVWLYAYKDIYDGTFCGQLHSSIDWSQDSGKCHDFTTMVATSNGLLGIKDVSSCSTSGSLQSTFVHPYDPGCYKGRGWIYGPNNAIEGNITTGCYNV